MNLLDLIGRLGVMMDFTIVHEIEDHNKKAAKNVILKSCDCEKWKARYKKYEQYLKAKNKMEKLEAELLKETRLPHKESK